MATSWSYNRWLGNFDPKVFIAKNALGEVIPYADTSTFDDWWPKPGVMKWAFQLRGRPSANPGDVGISILVPIPVGDLKTFPPPQSSDHKGPSRPIVYISPMSAECYIQQVICDITTDFSDPENLLAGAYVSFGNVTPSNNLVELLCVIDFSHSLIN